MDSRLKLAATEMSTASDGGCHYECGESVKLQISVGRSGDRSGLCRRIGLNSAANGVGLLIGSPCQCVLSDPISVVLSPCLTLVSGPCLTVVSSPCLTVVWPVVCRYLTVVSRRLSQFGDSQKLRLVRILRSTVMVRVGGGWEALDEFLVKNDPCRGETSRTQCLTACLTEAQARSHWRTGGVGKHCKNHTDGCDCNDCMFYQKFTSVLDIGLFCTKWGFCYYAIHPYPGLIEVVCYLHCMVL